jgi:hypothetical protein
VLFGQDFGRGHNGRLKAVGNCLQGGSGGHCRFTAANIALKQTRHWHRALHIGENFFERTHLRAG